MSFSNPAIVIGVISLDTAKNVLAGVDTRIRQTTQTIESEGKKINSKMSQISANFRANMAGIATTAAGLSADIVGLMNIVVLAGKKTIDDSANSTGFSANVMD